VAKKGEVEKFVIGLPLHMSGKESNMSEEVRAFGDLLEEMSQKEVVYFDERLTSSLVESMLKEGGLSRKERARHTDQLSATVLLRCYLDSAI
jgi:putative Holliday junction resolvase